MVFEAIKLLRNSKDTQDLRVVENAGGEKDVYGGSLTQTWIVLEPKEALIK